MQDIKLIFARGNYKEVINLLGKASLFNKNSPKELIDHWPLQVGSLVFMGEMLEAQTLYELALKQKKLNSDTFVQAQFYLGIGLVRNSLYQEALRHFAVNLKLANQLLRTEKENSHLFFYAFQGAAFYRFFQGRFKISKKLAEKAYRSAFESHFLLGQSLAAELMAHCNCQLGEVQKGLDDFQKAIQSAEELGNGGLSSAFKIATEKFKAQYGIDLKNSEKNLYRCLRTLEPGDTYSKAELYLELARQLILRGKTSEAKNLLDENSESIYKHQNRRQSATFNLRYAQILNIRGESNAALMLLRSSKGNLVPHIDRYYLKQLRGLEEKITRELYPNQAQSPAPTPFVNFIDERIYARENPSHNILIRSREDPLGDALDAAKRKNIDITDLKKIGLWGLAPTILNTSTQQSFIYLGPSRGQALLHSKGDIHWIEDGLTQPMVKILKILEGGSLCKKEKLIQEVWGYEYRPDRHDNLLHATVGKLRKILGPFAEWIEWNTGGYLLRSEIKILKSLHIAELPNNSLQKLPEDPSKNTDTFTPLPQSSDLNHRQIQLLKYLNDGKFVGVTEYSKKFKICKMTACRDLTSLWKKNILRKYGKARATQYGLN